MDRQFGGDFEHVQAEERHPCGSVRLLKIAAAWQRSAAVKDADVIQSEKAAFKDVLAVAILAVYPPGEVEDQLVEDGLEESDIAVAAHLSLKGVNEIGGPRMHRRIYVAEVPLIRGNLSTWMQVDCFGHQLQLLLGEIEIDQGERQRVEGEVPG